MCFPKEIFQQFIDSCNKANRNFNNQPEQLIKRLHPLLREWHFRRHPDDRKRISKQIFVILDEFDDGYEILFGGYVLYFDEPNYQNEVRIQMEVRKYYEIFEPTTKHLDLACDYANYKLQKRWNRKKY